MKKINLAITGCMGRMGRQIIKSAKSDKVFRLVSLTESKKLNKKINNIPKIRTVDIHNTMLEFLGIKSLNAIEGKKLDIY